MESNQQQSSAPNLGQGFSAVEDFNLGLLIYIVNKSVMWMVVIVITCVALSLAYLRYAPRIYEASTVLMLKKEKTTEILGIEKMVLEQDETEVSREMQLLKSRLLLERIIEHLPLQVGYYKEGKTKFIFSELYTQSPFEIEGNIKDERAQNLPIYVKIINTHQVYVGFTVNGRDFEFTRDTGKMVNTPYFDVIVHLKTAAITPETFSGIYYFKFLDKEDLMSEISDKLEVLPVDPKTKTIKLVYKDRNPTRAKEVISTVANEFIAYDLERKRESIINILRFIQTQIDTFGTSFDKFQDSVSYLRMAEKFYDKGDDYLNSITEKTMEYEDKFRAYDNDITLLRNFQLWLQKNKEYTSLPTIQFKIADVDFSPQIVTINDLQTKRNQTLLNATPQHPLIRMLDRQIDDAKIKLNKDIDNALQQL
ncbi:MAG: Wzz/FepE/Etk N-terminal domain-containing protein, partial [Chitinophagales bacterium]